MPHMPAMYRAAEVRENKGPSYEMEIIGSPKLGGTIFGPPTIIAMGHGYCPLCAVSLIFDPSSGPPRLPLNLLFNP